MECVICRHGETLPGLVMVPLQRGETMVIVKQVPAEICENCGEYYLSEAVTGQLLAMAEGALQPGAEVAVLQFAA